MLCKWHGQEAIAAHLTAYGWTITNWNLDKRTCLQSTSSYRSESCGVRMTLSLRWTTFASQCLVYCESPSSCLSGCHSCAGMASRLWWMQEPSPAPWSDWQSMLLLWREQHMGELPLQKDFFLYLFFCCWRAHEKTYEPTTPAPSHPDHPHVSHPLSGLVSPWKRFFLSKRAREQIFEAMTPAPSHSVTHMLVTLSAGATPPPPPPQQKQNRASFPWFLWRIVARQPKRGWSRYHACRPTRCMAYIMVHVRRLRTCPVLAEANSVLAFTLAAKWRFVLFTFVDLAWSRDSLQRSWFDQNRCTRHRRCRLAGGTDRNSLWAATREI